MAGCVFPARIASTISDSYLVCALDLRFALYVFAWAVLQPCHCMCASVEPTYMLQVSAHRVSQPAACDAVKLFPP